MTIQELISELSGYDPELEVRVWSAETNTDTEISQATQGYTAGVLDTYVSICIDDDLSAPDDNPSHHPYDEYARARYVDQALDEWKERRMSHG